MIKTYAAIYGHGPDERDGSTMSKYGFATEKEAWEYVHSKSCTPDCVLCPEQWFVFETDDELIRLIDEKRI